MNLSEEEQTQFRQLEKRWRESKTAFDIALKVAEEADLSAKAAAAELAVFFRGCADASVREHGNTIIQHMVCSLKRNGQI